MDFALMFIRRFMFISRLMLMIKIRLIKVGAGHLGHEIEAEKSLRTRLFFSTGSFGKSLFYNQKF